MKHHYRMFLRMYFVAIILGGTAAIPSAECQEPPVISGRATGGPTVGPADPKSLARPTEEQIRDHVLNPTIRLNSDDGKLMRDWIKRYRDNEEIIEAHVTQLFRGSAKFYRDNEAPFKVANAVIELAIFTAKALAGEDVDPNDLAHSLQEAERPFRELMKDLRNSNLNRRFAARALPIWDWPTDPEVMKRIRRLGQKGPYRFLDGKGSLMELNLQNGKVQRVYSEFSAPASKNGSIADPGSSPKELSAFLDRSFRARIGFDDGAKKTELLAAWESVAKAELERRKQAEKKQSARLDDLLAALRDAKKEMKTTKETLRDAYARGLQVLAQMKDWSKRKEKLDGELGRLLKKKQQLDREAARLRGSTDRNAIAAYNQDKFEQDSQVDQYLKNEGRLGAEKSRLDKAFDLQKNRHEQAQNDLQRQERQREQSQRDLSKARAELNQLTRETASQQSILDTIAAERGKLDPSMNPGLR